MRPKILGSLAIVAGIIFAGSIVSPILQAQTLNWQGYTWTVKSGDGLGPGPNEWNTNNVFVDTNGYLHLIISSNTASGFWDCAELYTTTSLGFGTYQWQIECRTDTLDPWVVLGLFPYAGPDGNNEIDFEYSRWGNSGNSNCWWTVYPKAGSIIGQHPFMFSLDGTYTTSRFTWSSSGVDYWLMGGHQPVGTTTNVISSWSYTPSRSNRNIPQSAMPLHMNLWLYQGHDPSNEQPVEVIIHSFSKS